ncbi:MAG: competence protein ComEC family protein [Patescibacteria group bacterium]|nr:competence protein ComEC family protein [Patescibacteria group bacterium]
MKSRIFCAYLLLFLAAISLISFLEVDFKYSFYFLLVSLVFANLFIKTKYLKYLFVGLFVVFLAFLRFSLVLPEKTSGDVSHFKGKDIIITGFVDSEPSGDRVMNFFFQAKRAEVDNEIYETKGRVLVTLRENENVKFGENLEIHGKLEDAKNNKFYKEGYLKSRGVFTFIDFPKFVKTTVDLSNKEKFWISVKRNLFYIKNKFVLAIQKILPEPDASLMLGLVLGIKKTMPDWLLQNFAITGTTHIIALSGFNITIIIAFLRNLTRNLSRRMSFWLPTLGVLLFVIMTGGEASVIRAAIMGFMLILAKKVGRQSDSKSAVFFAAALMVYLNPMILNYDLGFQLSFAAMIGIIFIAPFFEKIMAIFPKIISENLGMTLAAQFTTLPLILYNFGIISIIAPLANILILPLIPLAMLFGAVAGIFYFLLPQLGELLGWTSYLFTEYIIKTTDFLSKIPFSSFNLDVKNPFFVFVYYLIFIDSILVYMRFKKKYA